MHADELPILSVTDRHLSVVYVNLHMSILHLQIANRIVIFNVMLTVVKAEITLESDAESRIDNEV